MATKLASSAPATTRGVVSPRPGAPSAAASGIDAQVGRARPELGVGDDDHPVAGRVEADVVSRGEPVGWPEQRGPAARGRVEGEQRAVLPRFLHHQVVIARPGDRRSHRRGHPASPTGAGTALQGADLEVAGGSGERDAVAVGRPDHVGVGRGRDVALERSPRAVDLAHADLVLHGVHELVVRRRPGVRARPARQPMALGPVGPDHPDAALVVHREAPPTRRRTTSSRSRPRCPGPRR